ncbi:magnesium transporter [Streptobacillus canis]|uniref:magnesium transporter n=1 Tax=Streptobacillus canis TaxID=2678686 RepID=UPI0012E2300A|nr:magnesium transporter [Streptobacillus canis]
MKNNVDIDKLTQEEIDLLKQEIKNRLEHGEEEEYFEDADDIDTEEIAEDLQNLESEEEVEEFVEEHHTVDIADSFYEIEDDSELLRVFKLFSEEAQIEIFEQADEELQIRILNLLDLEESIDILTYLPPDDVADILGSLELRKSKEILDNMKRSDANKIRLLLGYADDTAGGIMTTQYIAFKKNLKIKDIMEKIKVIGPKTEYIETIFVLDEESRLFGEADLRDILIASDDTILEEITDENIIYVDPYYDQEKVAQIVSRYGLKVVPVVNRKGNMLGIITIDDVIDVINEENTEDILKLHGAGDDETLETTLKDSVSKRLPWLAINLVTAFLASFTVGLFSETIDAVVALAVSMPIVSGMGGNAGTQSLAVTIRSIALDESDSDDSWKISLKYIALGFINGIVLGVICAIAIYFFYKSFYLSFVIFLAMIGNCVIACLVGYLIPVGLKLAKIDPAMASAVVLTTITDICGFFLFLGLATVFLDKLV